VTESELGTTANLMIPEAKVGYRLVLGYGFGIEATGDIGTTLVLASGGGAEGVIFGGSLAFLLTF
jgi:hypothetical protein